MNNLFFIFSLILVSACGVRNDPIPPGTQAEIGKGRPSPKAWLVEKTKGVDPSQLQVLDYLEEKHKKKKDD